MAMVTPVNGLATILLDCSYCGVYKVGMLHALTGSYVQSSQVVSLHVGPRFDLVTTCMR